MNLCLYSSHSFAYLLNFEASDFCLNLSWNGLLSLDFNSLVKDFIVQVWAILCLQSSSTRTLLIVGLLSKVLSSGVLGDVVLYLNILLENPRYLLISASLKSCALHYDLCCNIIHAKRKVWGGSYLLQLLLQLRCFVLRCNDD